jgi:hypothetical protein
MPKRVAATRCAREAAERNEQLAIEADKLWRSQLSPGVPWYQIPPEPLPASAMLAAARDEGPRRRSPLVDFLTTRTVGRFSIPFRVVGMSRRDRHGTTPVPQPLAIDGVVFSDPATRTLTVRLADSVQGYGRLLWKQGWQTLRQAEESG